MLNILSNTMAIATRTDRMTSGRAHPGNDAGNAAERHRWPPAAPKADVAGDRRRRS
jgi:hypothetical protein